MKWLLNNGAVSPVVSNNDGDDKSAAHGNGGGGGKRRAPSVHTAGAGNSKFGKLRKLASEVEEADNVSQLEDEGKKQSIHMMVDKETFPFFDDEHFAKFIRFNTRHSKCLPEVPFHIIVLIKIVTRLNLAYEGQRGPNGTVQSDALFFIALALLVVLLVLGPLLLVPRCMAMFEKHKATATRLTDLFHTWFCGRLKDVVSVVLTLMCCFDLTGRVLAGECGDNVHDIWGSQRCNPGQASHSLPTDDVVLLLSLPIIAQLFHGNVHLDTLCFLWVAVLGFIIFNIAWLDGWHDLWVIVFAVVFVNISYIVERSLRMSYAQVRPM